MPGNRTLFKRVQFDTECQVIINWRRPFDIKTNTEL